MSANDFNPGAASLSASLVSDVSNGTLTLNADGTFTYTPDTGYTGPDSFTYQLDDGSQFSNVATVSLDVTNAAPTGVAADYRLVQDRTLSAVTPGLLAFAQDADGDALSVSLVEDVFHGTLTLNSNGLFTYTPEAGYTGDDSFTYQLSDGLATSAAVTVTLHVTEADDDGLPQAADAAKLTTGAAIGSLAGFTLPQGFGDISVSFAGEGGAPDDANSSSDVTYESTTSDAASGQTTDRLRHVTSSDKTATTLNADGSWTSVETFVQTVSLTQTSSAPAPGSTGQGEDPPPNTTSLTSARTLRLTITKTATADGFTYSLAAVLSEAGDQSRSKTLLPVAGETSPIANDDGSTSGGAADVQYTYTATKAADGSVTATESLDDEHTSGSHYDNTDTQQFTSGGLTETDVRTSSGADHWTDSDIGQFVIDALGVRSGDDLIDDLFTGFERFTDVDSVVDDETTVADGVTTHLHATDTTTQRGNVRYHDDYTDDEIVSGGAVTEDDLGENDDDTLTDSFRDDGSSVTTVNGTDSAGVFYDITETDTTFALGSESDHLTELLDEVAPAGVGAITTGTDNAESDLTGGDFFRDGVVIDSTVSSDDDGVHTSVVTHEDDHDHGRDDYHDDDHVNGTFAADGSESDGLVNDDDETIGDDYSNQGRTTTTILGTDSAGVSYNSTEIARLFDSGDDTEHLTDDLDETAANDETTGTDNLEDDVSGHDHLTLTDRIDAIVSQTVDGLYTSIDTHSLDRDHSDDTFSDNEGDDATFSAGGGQSDHLNGDSDDQIHDDYTDDARNTTQVIGTDSGGVTQISSETDILHDGGNDDEHVTDLLDETSDGANVTGGDNVEDDVTGHDDATLKHIVDSISWQTFDGLTTTTLTHVKDDDSSHDDYHDNLGDNATFVLAGESDDIDENAGDDDHFRKPRQHRHLHLHHRDRPRRRRPQRDRARRRAGRRDRRGNRHRPRR